MYYIYIKSWFFDTDIMIGINRSLTKVKICNMCDCVLHILI